MDDGYDIDASPGVFPCEADADWFRVRLIRLSPEDYRAASFLDGRLCDARPGVWVEGAQVRLAAALLPKSASFIFHIGHVGSTLLSRLVGEHPRLFSVREPALMRALGGAAPPGLSDVLLRLFSRTPSVQQTAVIKATSFVGDQAEALMREAPGARAILMFANPLAYLRGILGGPASRGEARALAPARLNRLHARLGVQAWRSTALSEGEAVAMSWLCEMSALHAAAAAHPDRIIWLNFDQFLFAPEVGLAAAVRALGAPQSPEAMATALAGPLMRTYSKGPEHAYDAELRAEVALQAEREHGGEIRRGMDWLGTAAGAFPLARAVLETAARQRPMNI